MLILKERFRKHRSRVPRFRRLKKMGVNTAKLVRTGLRAMTYGSAITGVPDGLLRGQRQTVAAIAAPGAGTCGQNLDFALMIAGEGQEGRADPSYDAHGLPIGEWAVAVWEGWENLTLMQLTIDSALERFAAAKNRWLVTCGICTRLLETAMGGDRRGEAKDRPGRTPRPQVRPTGSHPSAVPLGSSTLALEKARKGLPASCGHRFGKRTSHRTYFESPAAQSQNRRLDGTASRRASLGDCWHAMGAGEDACCMNVQS